MIALMRREIRLAWDQGSSLWVGALVFVLFCSLIAIGFGGNDVVLSASASGVIWASAAIGSLMAMAGSFGADLENGAIDQLRLRGFALWELSLAKILASCVSVYLPFVVASLIVGEFYALEFQQSARVAISLLLGGPALVAYGVLASALLASLGRGSTLGLLLMLPLVIPVVVFGEAAASSADALLRSPSVHALIGLSLVSIVVSTVASAAALGVHGE